MNSLKFPKKLLTEAAYWDSSNFRFFLVTPSQLKGRRIKKIPVNFRSTIFNPLLKLKKIEQIEFQRLKYGWEDSNPLILLVSLTKLLFSAHTFLFSLFSINFCENKIHKCNYFNSFFIFYHFHSIFVFGFLLNPQRTTKIMFQE